MKRLPLIITSATCLAVAAYVAPQTSTEKPHPLGPLAPIAAQVQWLRAHTARNAGHEARAFALMQSALLLEPKSTTAWVTLANQLGLQFASAESGRLPEERAEWLAAAVSLLQEGESIARSPKHLAMHRGLLLMSHAETDPDLPWPGGLEQLWLDAAEAFAAAAQFESHGGDHTANGSQDLHTEHEQDEFQVTAQAAADFAREQAPKE